MLVLPEKDIKSLITLIFEMYKYLSKDMEDKKKKRPRDELLEMKNTMSVMRNTWEWSRREDNEQEKISELPRHRKQKQKLLKMKKK